MHASSIADALSKLLVGPFLVQEQRLVPALVLIHNARFHDILTFPALALSEAQFRRAMTAEPQNLRPPQRLFADIMAGLEHDFRVACSFDVAPQADQEHFNAALVAVPREACRILDMTGHLLLPGLFDIHTHFRTPGQEWKEDFSSGSRAALRGGVTTVFDMPNNRQSITTQALLDAKKTLARNAMQVNYGFYFGITDENAATAGQIRGHCGYKAFLGSSTGSLLISDWRTTLPLCCRLPNPVIIHAEDEAHIRANMRQRGTLTPKDHPLIRPPGVAEAAVLHIEQALQHLPEPPRSPIIVAHISTINELKIIQRLQQQDLPVLAEVTPHHLYLNLDDFEQQPNLLKANPPLRSRSETLELQQALRQNAIAFISSDHAPHTLDEKYSDSPPSGVPGMEYTLLLLFDAFASGTLPLHTIVTACAANPSRYFGLPETGAIAPGRRADCVLVDPAAATVINNADVQTKAGFTPFHGRAVQGRVAATLVNGGIGYWHGDFFPTRPRDLFPDA